MRKDMWILMMLLLPLMLIADVSLLVRQADAKLDEADRLAQREQLAPAAAVYLQAADLYEQSLQQGPGNTSCRKNYLYSLGERAMIYVRRGQKAIKAGDFSKAAELYDSAIAAYDLALKKQPQEKNWQDNQTYCRHEWGVAQFQVKLGTKGPAFPFRLIGLDGAPVTLATLKGRVVLLEFAAGWCPTCRDSIPKLIELQKKLSSQAVSAVILSVDRVDGWKKSGAEETLRSLLKGQSITAAWADEETCRQYGSFNSIPTLILIDKNGRLAAQIPAETIAQEKLAQLIASIK
jgi:thiol-disulfide isomerase/thioredoxin